MRYLDAALSAGVKIDNVALWCRVNGVDRRTFYRHRDRFDAAGAAGLLPASRRPRNSPGATPARVVAAILELRASLCPDNGADVIVAALQERASEPDWVGAGLRAPSRSTVNRVLARAGLLDTNPRKRPKRAWRRFTFARPRDCYQIDGTTHVLADGSSVVAIDVIDDCSRVWVASYVTDRETTIAVITALTQAVTAFGAPALVLCDNGKAFTGRGVLPLTVPGRFARTVTDLGARLIHSSCYHPQTCGKCERLHQTAKKHLRTGWDTPASTPAELQARLDHARAAYNQRRHSAIKTTPLTAWHDAPALGGPQHLPIQQDAAVFRPTSDDRARIKIGRRHRLALPTQHKNQPVTVIIDGGHVTVYDLTGTPIAAGRLNPDTTYQRLAPAA
jgi:putative transposase